MNIVQTTQQIYVVWFTSTREICLNWLSERRILSKCIRLSDSQCCLILKCHLHPLKGFQSCLVKSIKVQDVSKKILQCSFVGEQSMFLVIWETGPWWGRRGRRGEWRKPGARRSWRAASHTPRCRSRLRCYCHPSPDLRSDINTALLEPRPTSPATSLVRFVSRGLTPVYC